VFCARARLGQAIRLGNAKSIADDFLSRLFVGGANPHSGMLCEAETKLLQNYVVKHHDRRNNLKSIWLLRAYVMHLLLVLICARTQAADLRFDTSFGSDPAYPGVAVVPAQDSLSNSFGALYLDKTSADRYLAIVHVKEVSMPPELRVARINNDGSVLDATTLPTIGAVTGDEIYFRRSCQTPSGAIYGVTYEAARTLLSIFRLHASGQIDLSFSDDGLMSRQENIWKIACYGEDLLASVDGGLLHIDQTGVVRFLPVSETIGSFGFLSDGKLYVLSSGSGMVRFTLYSSVNMMMQGASTSLPHTLCSLQPFSGVAPYAAFGGNDRITILLANQSLIGGKPAFITARVDAQGSLTEPACQDATFAGRLWNEPLAVEHSGMLVFGTAEVNGRSRQSLGRAKRIGTSLFHDEQFGNGLGLALPFEADLTRSVDLASAMVLDNRVQPSRLLLAGTARGAIHSNRLTMVRMVSGYFLSSGFE
jgi:hypothetical protein